MPHNMEQLSDRLPQDTTWRRSMMLKNTALRLFLILLGRVLSRALILVVTGIGILNALLPLVALESVTFSFPNHLKIIVYRPVGTTL